MVGETKKDPHSHGTVSKREGQLRKKQIKLMLCTHGFCTYEFSGTLRLIGNP